MRRLKQLEDENARLKKIVADLTLDHGGKIRGFVLDKGMRGLSAALMMGWVAPPDGTCATVVRTDQEGMAMNEVSIIGVDLAKQVFQLHGATAVGEVVFRKKLSRKQFVAFMRVQPGCCVAMEACATAHHWARTLMDLGHEVRLIGQMVQHDHRHFGQAQRLGSHHTAVTCATPSPRCWFRAAHRWK
mgnify:CR=1 FL=1